MNQREAETQAAERNTNDPREGAVWVAVPVAVTNRAGKVFGGDGAWSWVLVDEKTGERVRATSRRRISQEPQPMDGAVE